MDEISLDHDLTEQATMGFPDDQTGYTVLQWQEQNHVWPRNGVTIHSQNPAGRKRMEQIVERYYSHKVYLDGVVKFFGKDGL